MIHLQIIGGSIRMYKYRVKLFDENNNLIIYEDVTADGYCAELEARKKYPNYRIGEVTRINDSCEK